jgi:hypothetical protein
MNPMTRHWLWPLLLPFIGLFLLVPFYKHREPVLFGFPFFYWYQFAWVPVNRASDLDCIPDILP